jgi:hypothetical protein
LSEAEGIEEALVNAILRKGIKDPEDVFVFIPTYLLPQIMPEVVHSHESANGLSKRLRAMQLPKLLYVKGGPPDRHNGFWWIGSKALTNPEETEASAFKESSSPHGEPMCIRVAKGPPIQKVTSAATTSPNPAA